MAEVNDCLQHDVCVETISSSRSALMSELLSMQTWKASLPFPASKLKGFASDEVPVVDLFEYTDLQHQLCKKDEHLSPIQFDPTLYPPTNDGMKSLITELKAIGFKHGSNLICRNQPSVLNCFRCKHYVAERSTKSLDIIDEFSDDGVRVGIC